MSRLPGLQLKPPHSSGLPRRRLLQLLLLGSVAQPAAAQLDFTYEILKSPHPENSFGVVVRFGDLDGDGFNDIVIANAAVPIGGVSLAGALSISHGPLLNDQVEISSQSPSETEILGFNDI